MKALGSKGIPNKISLVRIDTQSRRNAICGSSCRRASKAVTQLWDRRGSLQFKFCGWWQYSYTTMSRLNYT